MSNTPFLRNSWDWRWPKELEVTRDDTVATITSPTPRMKQGVPIAPDLRALTCSKRRTRASSRLAHVCDRPTIVDIIIDPVQLHRERKLRLDAKALEVTVE